jgi:hypothetical protein
MTKLPAYKVVRRARLKKRIHLQRDAAGTLEVGAPRHWSDRAIHSLLQRHSDRVWRFLGRDQPCRPPPLAYVSGERHYFLGEQRRLAVTRAPRRASVVKPEAGELRVQVFDENPRSVRNCLRRWYREQAKAIFAQRLEALSDSADWARGRAIRFEVRRMRRTWGNCSSAGLIRLNTHLVKAPPALIDSVIAHELCHLVEMRHGPAFYRLLQELNPNWRNDRASLRQRAAAYLLE